MSKQTLFSFKAALPTLYEDIRMFPCCWPHKFSIKAFCAALNILCSWRWRVAQLPPPPHTHTEFIVLFPPQQWLCERTTMSRYTYISSLFHYADQLLSPKAKLRAWSLRSVVCFTFCKAWIHSRCHGFVPWSFYVRQISFTSLVISASCGYRCHYSNNKDTFSLQSVLRQVRSLFQRELCTDAT
jgi:hypothetical protein